LPATRKRRRRPRLLVLALLAAAVGAGWYFWPRGGSGPTVKVTGVATRGPLAITVTERGELESSSTVDARCEVEGREIKLVSILPEGTHVTKGQEVAKFDTEKLQKSYAEQKVKWEQAEGKAKAAKGELEVQINKGESEVAKAKLELTLAELERDKYLEGEYEVELNKIKGAIELAEKDLREAEDKLKFYRDYEKKGFGTPEQVRLRELVVEQQKYLLQMNKNSLMVLEKFTRKQKLTELTAKAEDAGRELVRKRKSSAASEEKARSDLKAAEVTAKLERQELDRIKAQLDKCVMKAPQDGILVYAKDRYWDPTSRIQAGAIIYFRQTVFTIPDLGRMQVKVKVHESVVKKIKPGLKADIVMDALPNQVLHGTVLSVGTMAYQEGYWSMGVKEYLTVVRVDDLPEQAGLKPGMTGEVRVLVNRLPDVLMAPVQAVAERAGRHVAYVVSPAGVERREVKVGENNEKFVEVAEGLAEGERVALDARARAAAEAKAEEEQGEKADKPTPKDDKPILKDKVK
jgi:RND family efflux transporter MFP subunit